MERPVTPRPLGGRPCPEGPSREHGSFHVHSGDPRGGGLQSPPQASTCSTSHLCPLATQPWTHQLPAPPKPGATSWGEGGGGEVRQEAPRGLAPHGPQGAGRVLSGRYQSLLCLALGGPRRPERLADSHHPRTGAPAVQALSRERQRPVRPSRPLPSVHPNPVPSCHPGTPPGLGFLRTLPPPPAWMPQGQNPAPTGAQVAPSLSPAHPAVPA